MAKYKKGDIIVEDRSQWIGTEYEEHCDKEFPVVKLEILDIIEDLDRYWMYNHTRNIECIGNIKLVDSAPENIIWKVSQFANSEKN